MFYPEDRQAPGTPMQAAVPGVGRARQEFRIVREWTVFTVAGTGAAGFSGDGGAASAAGLSWPRDVTMGGDGSLFIADTNNHRIRRIRTDGVIETIAGAGGPGYDGDGGPAAKALLNAPRGGCAAPDGTLFVVDTGNHCLRKIDRRGGIATIAGNGRPGYSGDGIPAVQAQLSWPQAVTASEDGSVYIADSGNHRVRKISPDGVISTIAGTGVAGYGGDHAPAVAAQLSHPRGIAMDRDGNLYVGDSDNDRVRKIAPNGLITTIAGTGRAEFRGDGGPALQADLAGPRGVAAADDGSLWIADCDNSAIRRVIPGGIIQTIAGIGLEGYTGDGGPAAAAMLGDPHGICATSAARIFFAEPHNHCIRMLVSPALPRIL